MVRTGSNEVGEPSSAVELGEEESGVGLGIRIFDRLEAGSDAAVVGATFAQYSATIATHLHLERERENRPTQSLEEVESENGRYI